MEESVIYEIRSREYDDSEKVHQPWRKTTIDREYVIGHLKRQYYFQFEMKQNEIEEKSSKISYIEAKRYAHIYQGKPEPYRHIS